MTNEKTLRVEARHRADLDAIYALVWSLLEDGVIDRRSAFHTPAVATVGKDGRPNLRTVVLRHASKAAWTLGFHTDRRSPKFAALRTHRQASFLIYDPPAKIQVLCSGSVELHNNNDRSHAAWQRSHPMSRVCYTQVQAPGTPLDGPEHAEWQTADGSAMGQQNFVVVVARLQTIEWLHLSAQGNRRALFSRDEAGHLSRTWIAP